MVAGCPAILLRSATSSACLFAMAAAPGPPVMHTLSWTVLELGSPNCHEVKPDVTNILAAASAAASAARCASLRATYRVTTSMDRAAMANMVTMAIATSTIVTPRSPLRFLETCATASPQLKFCIIDTVVSGVVPEYLAPGISKVITLLNRHLYV